MANKDLQTLSEGDIIVERDLVKRPGQMPEEPSDNLKLLGEIPAVDRPDPNCDVID